MQSALYKKEMKSGNNPAEIIRSFIRQWQASASGTGRHVADVPDQKDACSPTLNPRPGSGTLPGTVCVSTELAL